MNIVQHSAATETSISLQKQIKRADFHQVTQNEIERWYLKIHKARKVFESALRVTQTCRETWLVKRRRDLAKIQQLESDWREWKQVGGNPRKGGQLHDQCDHLKGALEDFDEQAAQRDLQSLLQTGS